MTDLDGVDETTIFKVLDGRKSRNGGTATWQKGRWKQVKGDLVPCRNGLHLVRGAQVLQWLGPDLWVAEYDGEMIDHGDKIVVRKARVVRHLDTWNERAARLFAADCAEAVLHVFELERPDDDRPRRAIEAARAYANGEIGTAAGATRDAAGAAASDADAGATRDAAWAAAAGAAAWAAVAGAAAWAGAWAGAWDAAKAAAGDAAAGAGAKAGAWHAARAAQFTLLCGYLNGAALK
jgi:hypothetical protein